MRWWIALVIISLVNAWVVFTTVKAMVYPASWSPVFTVAIILSWLLAGVLWLLMVRIWRRVRTR